METAGNDASWSYEPCDMLDAGLRPRHHREAGAVVAARADAGVAVGLAELRVRVREHRGHATARGRGRRAATAVRVAAAATAATGRGVCAACWLRRPAASCGVVLRLRGRGLARLALGLGLLDERRELTGDLRRAAARSVGLAGFELRPAATAARPACPARPDARPRRRPCAAAPAPSPSRAAVTISLSRSRGERAVLLLRREVLRVLRVELLDAAVRTALRVDGGGATGDLGAQLLRLRLGRVDERVGGWMSAFALSSSFCVELICSLSALELLGVAVDLRFELLRFRLLVADRVSDGDAGCCHHPERARRTGRVMTSLRARRFMWGLLRPGRFGPC